ncbi:Uma2 family endonuclease [Geminicoccus harenae]|uniref:Uma2 family endonuclease n=1 Tax=Geminicoccus harenae TaxID=2498453 RepID=UPI00168A40E0|nr:Uma2 family endonuclease [Geminicoccus harenae]
MSHPTLLPPIRMTRQEFDAWAPNQAIPYELIDGRVEPKYLSDDGLEAMAGGKVVHHLVIGNVSAALRARAPQACHVLPDARVRVGDSMIFLPDVTLTCEPIRDDSLDLLAPRLIVEVLSPSTQRQDRTAKLDTYRLIPSLEEIWLVRTRPRHVEVWQRRPDGWHVADVIGTGTIQSRVLQSPVPLDELYEGLPA